MKNVKIFGLGVKNIAFDPDSAANRDNCMLPIRLLKSKLGALGFELQTADMVNESDSAFEIHIDAKSVQNRSRAKKFLIKLETPLIVPNGSDKEVLDSFDRVFSWDKSSLTSTQVTPIFFAQELTVPVCDGFADRTKFSCMISGNKTAAKFDRRELYSERIKSIRWFEKNAPGHFDLYGQGWNFPPMRYGKAGRLLTKIQGKIHSALGHNPFPSYRGRVESKVTVLKNYKYCFCYENATGFDNYITEKIFDCFFAGCIPIYWGAPNITDIIPENCFIDRRKFENHDQLHEALKRISEEEYIEYQKNIINFLKSDSALPFSAEHFSEVIAENIAKDIGISFD
ncbi:glycosyltransferase family 10 domain-containing protein [Vogesella indigofera]|uniref:Glycosyltransferase family 10 n=1 Tax=Vogesella indigofera TaxID=45465 RepID=A0ABT5I0G4_VOGIN|nr:glycosyltransferase family 10 [Vogesella indigofera]MDC7689660.1 glycosyltransferase family 10 [Vogesella indigofera]